MSDLFDTDVSRRRFLHLLSASALAGLVGGCSRELKAKKGGILHVPAGQTAARFPEKTELIMLTDRPPQLETPLYFLRQDLTPNEAFFVRWHHSGIPTRVDLDKFRLNISGHVEKPLSLSVDDLKRDFKAVSIVAVNQCSGNSRSFFLPKVAGGQWQNGAVGNARWTGVPLKDLLERAGIKAGAVDVAVSGLDVPPMYNMDKFVKALEAQHTMDSEVLVAYEMNGESLPMLNGFPLRLVVPGWYATYWVKALSKIEVLDTKFKGFWMDKAYRIPNNADAGEQPEHLAKDTVPINRMNVRSLFVRPDLTADVVKVGQPTEIEGIAFDGGSGIARVEVSTDGGSSWQDAKLDDALGNFSFRRFRLGWTPASAGAHQLLCRAFNCKGDGQTTSLWNKSGYMRNVIEQMAVPVI